jgi:hypothetical protein
MRAQYDPRTAVTFLLTGVGLGALMALILAPRGPEVVVAEERRLQERRREPRAFRAV